MNNKILFCAVIAAASIFFFVETAAQETGNICNQGCSLDSKCGGSAPYLCKKSWALDTCVAKGYDGGFCGGKTDKGGYCFECSGGCVSQNDLGGKCGLFTTCSADEYCCKRADWYTSNSCVPKYSDMGCCGGPPSGGDRTTFLKTTITNNKADACTSKIKWEVKTKNSASFTDYSADCIEGNPDIKIDSKKSIEATCTSQKLPSAASGPHKKRITWCGESAEFEYGQSQTSDSCKGIVCGGFCYATAFNGKCFDGYFAESSTSKACSDDNDCSSGNICNNNHVCESNTDNSISLSIEVPESVPISSMFNIKVIVRNKLDKPQTITIEPLWYPATSQYKNVKEDITLAPFETRSLSYEIKSGQYKTFIGSIGINLQNGRVQSKPIVTFDPSETNEKCGNKISKIIDSAVCKDNILYPTSPFILCKSDNECNNGKCIENVCINYYDQLKPDKSYKVTIVPIFIYDDDKIYSSDKNSILSSINNVIDYGNNWFVSEKSYWQTNSQFTVKYTLGKECRLTKIQYKNLLNQAPTNDYGQTFSKSLLSQCNVNLEANSLVGLYELWQNGLKDQNIDNGLIKIGRTLPTNYGNVFTLINIIDNDVLIHETLHSFGEKDLYLLNGVFGANYQWNDCLLYKTRSGLFLKHPHLCNFEASIIGWSSSSGTTDISVILKYPETYGQPTAKSLKLTCKKVIHGNIQPVEIAADYDSINLGNGLQILKFKLTKEKLQQLKDAGCDW